MKHYGDITKIHGYDMPPVDCITGGSPCQDLSVAGKRAGLDGERSGLFMEQIRVIKEMREHDRDTGRTGRFIRPRWMVWENVPGAFSSNGGEDFRIVLEETAKIADPYAVIPRPAKWTPSGCIMGDGWSIAWRVHDAQFWGVPQRRKRIALVADFGGLAAPEILFERESLSGDLEPCGEAGQETAGAAGSGVEGADFGETGIGYWQNGIQTLRAEGENRPSRPSNVVVQEPILLESNQNHATVQTDGISTALPASMGMGGGYVPMVTAYGISSYDSNAMKSSNPHSGIYEADTARTLDNNGGSPACNQGGMAIVQAVGVNGDVAETLDANYFKGCGERQGTGREVVAQTYQKTTGALCAGIAKQVGNQIVTQDQLVTRSQTVRRLTPLECERLQGFPDGWTDIGEWTDSKGKMRKCSDSARYKALGNSIAIPFWFYILRRMAAQYERSATLGSLFDGIGGFPYAWEKCNGEGTAVWASEIEEFPIAVTKAHFPEREETE